MRSCPAVWAAAPRNRSPVPAPPSPLQESWKGCGRRVPQEPAHQAVGPSHARWLSSCGGWGAPETASPSVSAAPVPCSHGQHTPLVSVHLTAPGSAAPLIPPFSRGPCFLETLPPCSGSLRSRRPPLRPHSGPPWRGHSPCSHRSSCVNVQSGLCSPDGSQASWKSLGGRAWLPP